MDILAAQKVNNWYERQNQRAVNPTVNEAIISQHPDFFQVADSSQ